MGNTKIEKRIHQSDESRSTDVEIEADEMVKDREKLQMKQREAEGEW
ncbi:hypothetical protein [Undibacterium griseum]|uniref:Uncharacterized protein n=1 Tax=Undibacterium griseum TaxID=2762295 RepID=A0ABR6YJI7_9BURK|nr:hypothetical protein [Undibacterium griseum]MBC3884060.1 hypothetical protein [Undibacterium griseum]